MKNGVQNAALLAGKFDSRAMRLVWLLISLTLFVLSAGAPAGDAGHFG